MECPHCHESIGLFSKEMNRFGREKFCPHCKKGIRLTLSIKALAILFIPAVLLIFILKQVLISHNFNGSIITGLVTGIAVALSMRLKGS